MIRKKRMMYDDNGTRLQTSIVDATSHPLSAPATLRLGVIARVNPPTSYIPNDINSPNRFGSYITYDILINPVGILIQGVPALGSGGSYANPIIGNIVEQGNQNNEEIPYAIGQPVLVGCFSNSGLNNVIIGAFPSQNNNNSPSGDLYPQRVGYFQGTSWNIDKNGNPTLNIATNGVLNIQINGIPFLTIDGSTNTINVGQTTNNVNLGAATDPTIMAYPLNSFITSLVNAFNNHTHLVPALSEAPTSTPVPIPTFVPVIDPGISINTTVVKVS